MFRNAGFKTIAVRAISCRPPAIELPSAALRSANLRLQDNGQGAVSSTTYLAEPPSLVPEINANTIPVKPDTAPPGGCGGDLDPARAEFLA